jgi:hypothetical protein
MLNGVYGASHNSYGRPKTGRPFKTDEKLRARIPSSQYDLQGIFSTPLLNVPAQKGEFDEIETVGDVYGG